jgi:hypothetical protein
VQLGFKGQLAVLSAFSFFLIVQTGTNCFGGDYSCGSGENLFTFVLSLAYLMFLLLVVYAQVFKPHELTTERERQVCVGFFAWWVVSAFSFTFVGPFNTVRFANGFFSAWGGFFFSTAMLFQRSETFKTRVVQTLLDKMWMGQPASFVLAFSVMELVSALCFCLPRNQCHSLNAFAIALGAVSVGLSGGLVVFGARISFDLSRQMATFLLVWWTIGGMLVTFIRPFSMAGNGYFAVVGAVGSSAVLLIKDNSPVIHHHFPLAEEDTDDVET